jgi:hypothetical protein
LACGRDKEVADSQPEHELHNSDDIWCRLDGQAAETGQRRCSELIIVFQRESKYRITLEPHLTSALTWFQIK